MAIDVRDDKAFNNIGPRGGKPLKSRGFSLFELMAFIIISAIVYSAAANRFARLPADAEKANFLAITTQVQAAVSLEMMLGITSGKSASMARMIGTNPMEYLLQPPRNYVGVLNGASAANLPERSWYFDSSNGELVYQVSNRQGVFLSLNGTQVPAQEIRFRIEAKYGAIDVATGLPAAALESGGGQVGQSGSRAKLSGVLMRPVIPYTWQTAEIDVASLGT